MTQFTLPSENKSDSNLTEHTGSIYPDFVTKQRDYLPQIYGKIDFSQTPERFTIDPDVKTDIPSSSLDQRERLLANEENVALIRNYMMVGDQTADAYAALIPEYGFRRISSMLETAVSEGIEAVEDAPQELIDFIANLEAVPDWIDMDLVEEGARQDRIYFVHLAPFAIRGGLLATFMNKYSALPMAITGAFSNTTSARRVFETGSFFAATIMPGGMRRQGGGFLAAAKVRLMHSMVRFNIMQRGKWDSRIYGVPIPQVDQMPAGMFGMYLLSVDVLNAGRTQFTPQEQARVEMYRYRCYLLGLPEELLKTTPQGIFDIWMTLLGSQRAAFDDATCGELVRSTMGADLTKDKSLKGKIHSWMEVGFSKTFFVYNFYENDAKRAAQIGIEVRTTDKIAAVVAAVWIYSRIFLFTQLDKFSFSRDWVDRRMVDELQKLLVSYGHANFVTDASTYQHANKTQAKI